MGKGMLKNSLRFVPIIALLMLFLLAVQLLSDSPFISVTTVSYLFAITIGILILSIILNIFYTFHTNPMSISMSLVGFPKAGKTVFLTMLFESLQRTNDESIRFFPYGEQTINRVTGDTRRLRKGKWLKPTSQDQVFIYRANTSIKKKSLFQGKIERKYKIEIADYAGEHIGQFDTSSDRWLHKTDYFNFVIDSDAILFALDIDKYFDRKEKFFADLDGIIASIQVLAEKKGAIYEKLDEPVAILFLKSDLISRKIEDTKSDIIEESDRLISICRNRFKNVELFFVSSVGKLNFDFTPRHLLEPSNVVQPLLWILSKAKETR